MDFAPGDLALRIRRMQRRLRITQFEGRLMESPGGGPKGQGHMSSPAVSGGKTAFRIIAVLFFLCQLAIIGFLIHLVQRAKRPQVPASEPETPAVAVQVATLAPRRIEEAFWLPGRIESWLTVNLAAEVEGQISRHGATEGDLLAPGDLVVTIDDRDYAARLRQAEAELARATADFTRIERLFRAESAPARDLDLARSQKILAEAAVTLARTALERCEIRSPLAGRLDDLLLEVGEHAQIGRAVAVIHQVDRVRLVFGVPENCIQAVATGQEVSFTAGTLAGTGRLCFLAVAADPGSLSFRAEAEVTNPELQLRPGMIVRVKLVRRALPAALVVPLTAIIPQFGAHYVFVADATDRAELREIKIDFIAGRDAVIAEGLQPGERIVVEGLQLLREHTPLRPVAEPAAAGPTP